MYQYYIYGVGIQSEIKLYELEECKAKQDVLIHYGKIPEDIVRYTEQGLTSSMSSVRVWFRNDAGHFVITGGNDILVQPSVHAKEDDLASFVLGWGLAFLFQMRGFSAIHSSAMEIKNHAVLISGVSGAGKSTIALSLIDAGYRYLADDIAMVNPKEDMIIQPAFPQQKVCRNVAEQIGTEKLRYINEKKDKFAYCNTENFCWEPRKLTTLIILKKYEGASVKIEEITGVEKISAVINNLFLLDAYKAMGITIEEKARCLELAGKLSIYTIYRPADGDTVQEIRDAVINLTK